MKLVISYDELFDQSAADMEDITYWDLAKRYIENQFPEWNIETAFIQNTFQSDWENNEVSIEFRLT